MPSCKYRELAIVCEALGLEKKNKKKGYVYWGISPLNNGLTTIIVHQHAAGRDIPDGLFIDYIKKLGFKSAEEFYEYLKNNK